MIYLVKNLTPFVPVVTLLLLALLFKRESIKLTFFRKNANIVKYCLYTVKESWSCQSNK